MPTHNGRLSLRDWTKTHIDENCEALSGSHENALFYNCTFNHLRNVTLKNCVLTGSKFLTKDLRDALGFTMTLGDCGSFKDVEYSEELFDLYLCMAIMTKGNTEKRRKLLDIVGRDRVREILQTLSTLER